MFKRNILINELCQTHIIKSWKKLFKEIKVIQPPIEIDYISIKGKQIGNCKDFRLFIHFNERIIPYINGGLNYIEMINNIKLTGKSFEECRIIRKQTQKEIEKTFFDGIFGENKYVIDKLCLISPFSCYASSGGEIQIDDDYWKISDEDISFRRIGLFESNIKYVSQALVKTAKEIFPNSIIRRDGDNINIFPSFE